MRKKVILHKVVSGVGVTQLVLTFKVNRLDGMSHLRLLGDTLLKFYGEDVPETCIHASRYAVPSKLLSMTSSNGMFAHAYSLE